MTTLQRKHVFILATLTVLVLIIGIVPHVATGAVGDSQPGETVYQTNGEYSEENSTDFDFTRDDAPPEYVNDGTPTRLQWFQLWSYKDTNVMSNYIDEYNITDQRIAEVFIQDKLWQRPPTAPYEWNLRNFQDIHVGDSDTSYYPESANTQSDLGIEDAHLTIHSYGPRTTLVNGDERENYVNNEYVSVNGLIDYRETSIDGDDYSDAENIQVDYEITEIRFLQDDEVIKTVDGKQKIQNSFVPEQTFDVDGSEFTVEADIEGEVEYDVPPPPPDDDDDDDDDGGYTPPPGCTPGSPACISPDPGTGSDDGGDDGGDAGGSDPIGCGVGDVYCVRDVGAQQTNTQYSGVSDIRGGNTEPKQATPPDSISLTVSDSFDAQVEEVGGYAKVAEFPDGTARYYINPRSVSPWDSAELPNGQVVNNGWQYYSHRDTSWDTIMRGTEDGEEVFRDGIDPNEIFWANNSRMRPAETKAVPTDIMNQDEDATFEIGYTETFNETPDGVTDVNENVGFIRPNEPFERVYALEVITNEPLEEGNPTINGFVQGTESETEILSEYEVEYADLETEVVEYNNVDRTADMRISLTDNNGNPINTGERGGESWIEVNGERHNTGVDGEVTVTVDQQPNNVIRHHPYPWWKSWSTGGTTGQGPITDPESIDPTPPDVDKKFAEQSIVVESTSGEPRLGYLMDMIGVIIFLGLLLYICFKTIDIVFGTSLWPFWR